jgi:two-component system, NtrC family, response regulator AtoC
VSSHDHHYTLQSLIGASGVITTLRRLLAKVARNPTTTVLITGESGSGKDLVAKVIHYNSDRAARPFMNITCSALAEPLLESELFGHERGAFTDARAHKAGLLEVANGGTVFLDEIGEMVPALQAKLLRFLEERSFRHVGGERDVHVDVRVIAATNRHLDEDVASGRFRRDLFYRLNVVPIAVPPLRTYAEDIPLLVQHFVDEYNVTLNKHITGATPAASALLQRYPWPGNVRELRNVLERAMLLTDGTRLDVQDFASLINTATTVGDFRLPAAGIDFEQLERSLVLQALERTGWNQTRAAVLLGMNRDQIRYRVEKFGFVLHGGREEAAAVRD